MAASMPAEAGRKYDLGFAKWVYENIDGGDKLSMCMQCGVCSGSCPIGVHMDHGPRKLFMMIRAGMKEAVMTSNTMQNCVLCYRCIVRCPRNVPVASILQDLLTKSVEQGYQENVRSDNARFGKSFWDSTRLFGRTDERFVMTTYFFSFGLLGGIRKTFENLKIALGMVWHGRMHLGTPHRIKGAKGLRAALEKAQEIEEREGRTWS